MDITLNPRVASAPGIKNNEQAKSHPPIGNTGKGQVTTKGEGNAIAQLEAAYGEKKLKALGLIECVTCAERRYVDGSNDGSVSFKTPGKISPEASAAVVMGHEMEHVSNEKADAAADSREIISQSVSLQSAVCAECGKSYVAGGTTTTVSKSIPEYEPSEELLKGFKFDQKI